MEQDFTDVSSLPSADARPHMGDITGRDITSTDILKSSPPINPDLVPAFTDADPHELAFADTGDVGDNETPAAAGDVPLFP